MAVLPTAPGCSALLSSANKLLTAYGFASMVMQVFTCNQVPYAVQGLPRLTFSL